MAVMPKITPESIAPPKKGTKCPPPVNPITPRRKGERKLKSETRTEQGLTVVQEAYCRARAVGMSRVEALGAIGSPRTLHTATHWEEHVPQVRARINELSKMATDNAILKTGLDRGWVIGRLMSVVERCMQAEPVLDKKTGEPTGAYVFDATGANQALRMLGDTLQLFKPVEKKPEDDYAQLSDDDIARITAELGRQTGLLTHD